MAKNKVWICDKKFYQTDKCMIMVALATEMDCRYHPRVYVKYRPTNLWDCYIRGDLWYKGRDGEKNAMEQAMEMFHGEFDKDNPVEINYSENNALCFGGKYDDEITMKEKIIDCLKANFPGIQFGFTN